MKKEKKKQIENFIELLPEVHKQMMENLITNESVSVALIQECCEGLSIIKNIIVSSEGEQHESYQKIESYVQLLQSLLDQLYEKKVIEKDEFSKKLQQIWRELLDSVTNGIKEKLEVVFMPYKASMWDSLESIWREAKKDCDTYVVPIPYYSKNKDGSLGEYHYEGNALPSEVPVTYYEDFDLEERNPDIIYIHNPYDDGNFVTTVKPQYYSYELKKYTKCLVYIPYYISAGNLGDGHANCPAYDHVDYIVVQAEKYRNILKTSLSSKILPLGSPKIDRVIRICNEERQLPESWKEKMEGKRVYFYNTSINGMLANTAVFLKKVKYVFECFEGREDICLLWRPHPLLESSFESLRPEHLQNFLNLKNHFLESGLGIYDDTPDVTESIALSDAYIGDSGSSVTSLFEFAGKPLFILNNQFHSVPTDSDIKNENVRFYHYSNTCNWMIDRNNELYRYSDRLKRFKFVSNLSKYASGYYYRDIFEENGKTYICPFNAEDILVFEKDKFIKKIELKKEIERAGAFYRSIKIGHFLFLIPKKYPAIVRYDMVNDKVDYIKGYNHVFVKNYNGEVRVGGCCQWKEYLLIASPTDETVLMIQSETQTVQKLSTKAKQIAGAYAMASDGNEIWIAPYGGMVVKRWNPETGMIREYDELPNGFACKNKMYGIDCYEQPFATIAFSKDKVYFSPLFGNMFVSIDKATHCIQKWEPPFSLSDHEKNGYYHWWGIGAFIKEDSMENGVYDFFSRYEAKLYRINLETEEYQEVPVEFDVDEIRSHEFGFYEQSGWMPYACYENVINSLPNFLNGEILGNPFERERQLKACKEVAANCDGTAGRMIHRTISKKVWDEQ